MPRDFFDPTPEQQNVILIDASTLQKAGALIESCEYCNPEAEIPFDLNFSTVSQVLFGGCLFPYRIPLPAVP